MVTSSTSALTMYSSVHCVTPGLRSLALLKVADRSYRLRLRTPTAEDTALPYLVAEDPSSSSVGQKPESGAIFDTIVTRYKPAVLNLMFLSATTHSVSVLVCTTVASQSVKSMLSNAPEVAPTKDRIRLGMAPPDGIVMFS